VERFLSELGLITSPSARKEEQGRAGSTRWAPPPAGMAKLDVDAAVAPDEAGRFLGASALVMTGITESETLETLVCREGLSLASDLLLQSPFGKQLRECGSQYPFGTIWSCCSGYYT
jgi:hypothetical protein